MLGACYRGRISHKGGCGARGSKLGEIRVDLGWAGRGVRQVRESGPGGLGVLIWHYFTLFSFCSTI